MAFEQIRCFAWIEILNNISERCLMNKALESIEEHRDKLLDILLHHDIDRFTEWFIGNTEIFRCVIDSGCFFEIGENLLSLMQQIIINNSERFLLLIENFSISVLLIVIDPQ